MKNYRAKAMMCNLALYFHICTFPEDCITGKNICELFCTPIQNPHEEVILKWYEYRLHIYRALSVHRKCQLSMKLLNIVIITKCCYFMWSVHIKNIFFATMLQKWAFFVKYLYGCAHAHVTIVERGFPLWWHIHVLGSEHHRTVDCYIVFKLGIKPWLFV